MLIIFLCLLAGLYLWGCVVANRDIRHSTQEYDMRILVKGTLMSWVAVLLMAAD